MKTSWYAAAVSCAPENDSSIDNSSQPMTANPPGGYDDLIGLSSVRIFVMTIHLLLHLLSILGNLMVMLVISKRRSLRRSSTTLLIFNLAICDFSSSVYRPLLLLDIVVPFSSTSYVSFASRSYFCPIILLYRTTLLAVSFLTIVAISQERLLLIAYPLVAKHYCKARIAKLSVAVIWLFGIATILPIPLLLWKMRILQIDETTLCLCSYDGSGAFAGTYFSVVFIIYYIIPVFVLSVTYTRIFRRLSRRSIGWSRTGRNKRERRTLARMMLAVAALFTFAWGPNFSFHIFLALGGRISSNAVFMANLIDIPPFLSSAANPFIYTLNSRTFRRGLRSLVCPRSANSGTESSILRSFGRGDRRSGPTSSCNNISDSFCNVQYHSRAQRGPTTRNSAN